jgi:hypothetical protein
MFGINGGAIQMRVWKLNYHCSIMIFTTIIEILLLVEWQVGEAVSYLTAMTPEAALDHLRAATDPVSTWGDALRGGQYRLHVEHGKEHFFSLEFVWGTFLGFMCADEMSTYPGMGAPAGDLGEFIIAMVVAEALRNQKNVSSKNSNLFTQ